MAGQQAQLDELALVVAGAQRRPRRLPDDAVAVQLVDRAQQRALVVAPALGVRPRADALDVRTEQLFEDFRSENTLARLRGFRWVLGPKLIESVGERWLCRAVAAAPVTFLIEALNSATCGTPG